MFNVLDYALIYIMAIYSLAISPLIHKLYLEHKMVMKRNNKSNFLRGVDNDLES